MEAGEDKAADGAGSGGEAADGAVGDGDDAADGAEGGEDGAEAMEEGAADGVAPRDGAVAAVPASKDSYLLQADDLKGDELSSRTGQLDVMLEYLWQVRPSRQPVLCLAVNVADSNPHALSLLAATGVAALSLRLRAPSTPSWSAAGGNCREPAVASTLHVLAFTPGRIPHQSFGLRARCP